MGSRTWIKIYCEKWLSEKMRALSVFDRGIWIDLLVLAGNGLYGDTGLIGLTSSRGLSDRELANIIGISRAKWMTSKRLFRELDMLQVINNRNVLKITNWSKYQSEYNRQKGYRSKLQDEVRPKVTMEKEKEKRKEKKRGETPRYTPETTNPKAGTSVQRQAEYSCPYCSKSQNKPITHFYEDSKYQDCYKKIMEERKKTPDLEPF